MLNLFPQSIILFLTPLLQDQSCLSAITWEHFYIFEHVKNSPSMMANTKHHSLWQLPIPLVYSKNINAGYVQLPERLPAMTAYCLLESPVWTLLGWLTWSGMHKHFIIARCGFASQIAAASWICLGSFLFFTVVEMKNRSLGWADSLFCIIEWNEYCW